MHKEVIKLEEELRQAMIANDVETLDVLIAESLVFTGPTGQLITKQMDLDCHRSGIQKISKLSPLEQTVQIYENFAVVTVKMNLVGTFANESINGKYRYTRIWSRINNSLQLVAGAVVKVQD